MSSENGENILCDGCQEHISRKTLIENLLVCPICGFHFRLSADQRIEQLLDSGTFVEYDADIEAGDPFDFVDRRPHMDRLEEARRRTGMKCAVRTGEGTICGFPVVVGVTDFEFIGGSFGWAEGEKLTRAIERATERHVPFLAISGSGGGRLQEAAISLMQAAKISAAIEAMSEAGGLSVGLAADPCAGGAMACYVSQGDIVLAEPGAYIGFTGASIIREITGQELPEDFQRAERLLKRGLLDLIVPRDGLRSILARLFRLHGFESSGKEVLLSPGPLPSSEALTENAESAYLPVYDHLTPWQKVQIARHPYRPTTLDFIHLMCDDFIELHGDRRGADDPAIVGGPALLEGGPVMIVGHQKGGVRESALRGRGMAGPGGLGKAQRLMRHAEKFRMPVVCLIDTPGAEVSVKAEDRGMGMMIGRSLREMSALQVPVVSVITGEGGSGGALALGVANRVLMLEHAIYSIISPEGCARILWRDERKASRAAEILKLTAQDLQERNLIEEIVPEPTGGAHRDPGGTARALKDALVRHLRDLAGRAGPELRSDRRDRFRTF